MIVRQGLMTVDEALAVIGRETKPIAPADSAVAAAHGAVLAEPVSMGEDSPSFDRAVVDGYALGAADAAPGSVLQIIGRQDAGGALVEATVGAGQCVGVNTGGRLPAGADAVVMVEHTEPAAGGVKLGKAVAAGNGIQRRGADARAGDAVLPQGVRMNAGRLSVAVAAGAAHLSVRRVRMSVLATGDELVAAGVIPGVGQIRNSNGLMLAALGTELGCLVTDLGVAGDTLEVVRRRLEEGLAAADLLVVCGGMSMGTRDLVPPVLKEMGVRIVIEKVRMKPGKPFLFGVLGDGPARKYVAGLPGNPVSAYVTFQRFVRAALRRMGGEQGQAEIIDAVLAGRVAENGDREFYQPCLVRFESGRVLAEPVAWKGSADLFALGRAGGLIVRAAGEGASQAGDLARVLLLGN